MGRDSSSGKDSMAVTSLPCHPTGREFRPTSRDGSGSRSGSSKELPRKGSPRTVSILIPWCFRSPPTPRMASSSSIPSKKSKDVFPEAKTISGLSNISFGLPKRTWINQSFLVLSLGAGLDAAILSPLDKNLMALVRSTEAFLNKDTFLRQIYRSLQKRKIRIKHRPFHKI